MDNHLDLDFGDIEIEALNIGEIEVVAFGSAVALPQTGASSGGSSSCCSSTCGSSSCCLLV